MKSTYKLLGVYWDNIKTQDSHRVLIKNTPYSSNIISFKKLLTVQSKSDFDNILSSLDTNKEIYINIDYWTNTSSQILCKFLKKRLVQMIASLMTYYPIVYCFKE